MSTRSLLRANNVAEVGSSIIVALPAHNRIRYNLQYVLHHDTFVRTTELPADLTAGPSTPQKQLRTDFFAILKRSLVNMKLFVSSEDYCLVKVKLALALGGKECAIETGVAASDLANLDTTAKSMLLETPMGYVSQHVAILRYVADAALLGATDLDRAMVDQWLEFSWQELGAFFLFSEV